jgi:hypothetical protein
LSIACVVASITKNISILVVIFVYLCKKDCFIPLEAFDRSNQPKKLPQDIEKMPVRNEKTHKKISTM